MLYPPKKATLKQLNGETGEVETTLQGGERIFSIPHTKEIVTTALKAKTPDDYKSLGARVIAILNIQDNTEPEFV